MENSFIYNVYDSYTSENSFGSNGYIGSNGSDVLSGSSDYSGINHSVNYYRRKKWSSSRNKQNYQTIQTYRTPQITNKSNNYELCSVELGYTSNLSKNTPVIKFLIDKRINFCQLGNSSHIAAFVPVSFNTLCCFIQYGKWKGYYR